MKTYIIEGDFKIGTKWQHFKKSIQSNNEKNARERIYSLIGSEHGLKRNQIKINAIKEV
ncbi:MAG: 50S ribosomal protein L18Ae [Methanocellales archaeon]